MKAWYEYLCDLEVELGKGPVKKWLRSLKIQNFDACNLYLEAEDPFYIQWFSEHIEKRARSEFLNNNGKAIQIHVATATTEPIQKKKEFTPNFHLRHDELDPKTHIDQFFISEKNKVILKFFNEWITNYPSTTLNPIFLHGSSGSGKTHLLMAYAKALREKGANVFFVKAQTFTNHVVEAIRFGNMYSFRKAYRSMDVLIVDDIHIFSKRSATQEEFFHTFNTLHTANKHILISSQNSPQKLQGIEPRLISRFEWGINLHLEKPDQSDLKEILQRKAKALYYPIQSKDINFLINNFTSSPKALYQALEATILRSHMGGSLPKVLRDLIEAEGKRRIDSEKIIRSVAECHGMKASDLLGKAQSKDCTLPRQIAMYFCRNILKLPYKKIGEIFSRDHSTVMTSVKQIEKSLLKREIAASIYEIKEKLEESHP